MTPQDIEILKELSKGNLCNKIMFVAGKKGETFYCLSNQLKYALQSAIKCCKENEELKKITMGREVCEVCKEASLVLIDKLKTENERLKKVVEELPNAEEIECELIGLARDISLGSAIAKRIKIYATALYRRIWGKK